MPNPTTPIGPAQTPDSFEGSHINPAIRRALSEQSSEIKRGVERVADAKPSPSEGIVR